MFISSWDTDFMSFASQYRVMQSYICTLPLVINTITSHVEPISWANSIGPLISLFRSHKPTLHSTAQRLALWHPLDRLDITPSCIYTACLRGRYFTRGCHVAFSVMNTRTESMCFHVTTESVSQRIRRHQNYIQPYKSWCPGRFLVCRSQGLTCLSW